MSMLEEKAAEVIRAVNAKIAQVRDALSSRIDQVSMRQDHLARQFSEFPVPKDGKDADPDVVAALVDDCVKAAVAQIPPAPAGKDADPEVIRAAVDDAVRAAVAKLPPAPAGKDADAGEIAKAVLEQVLAELDKIEPPKDGKDADPELMRLQIAEEVSRQVALIPRPADGKSVDLAELTQAIIDAAAKAVAAMPKPADGKDATPEQIAAAVKRELEAWPKPEPVKAPTLDDLRPLVDEAVSVAVRSIQIPAPIKGDPGKDADPELVRGLVRDLVERGFDDAVHRAVAEIPKPQDGKSVAPEHVAEMVRAAVAAIPAPKDGRDIDPDQVRAAIAEMVAQAVAEIPVPKDGRSVDPDVIRAMVAEAVAQIPKPKDAEPVHPDTLALAVKQAVDAAMLHVRMPRDGDPGRDALDIEILPAIDETRSYPRATYAQHRGGLVRSLRATDPVVDGDMAAAGWAFIMRGIDSETEECLDQGRIIKRVTVYSDGTKLEREHKTAAQIYRNVYREGVEYERGDTTTFGGCTWHCNVSGTKRKPGEVGSDDWTLQAKRGRDGKDGVVTTPNPPGPVRIGS